MAAFPRELVLPLEWAAGLQIRGFPKHRTLM